MIEELSVSNIELAGAEADRALVQLIERLRAIPSLEPWWRVSQVAGQLELSTHVQRPDVTR